MDEDVAHSTEAIETWLRASKAALLAQGFKRDAKQFKKPGQAWGLIRQEPDDMQIHVRAFKDGRLESEVELSNKFLQHLWSHRRNAAPEVKEILEDIGLPTHFVNDDFQPITGSKPGKVMPDGRTKNWVVTAATFALMGVALGGWIAARAYTMGLHERK